MSQCWPDKQIRRVLLNQLILMALYQSTGVEEGMLTMKRSRVCSTSTREGTTKQATIFTRLWIFDRQGSTI